MQELDVGEDHFSAVAVILLLANELRLIAGYTLVTPVLLTVTIR
jgi:hypothetical protein